MAFNLFHIESRLSRQNKTDHEFYIECDSSMGSLTDVIKQLREESKFLHVLSRAHKTLDESGMFTSCSTSILDENGYLVPLVSTKNA